MARTRSFRQRFASAIAGLLCIFTFFAVALTTWKLDGPLNQPLCLERAPFVKPLSPHQAVFIARVLYAGRTDRDFSSGHEWGHWAPWHVLSTDIGGYLGGVPNLSSLRTAALRKEKRISWTGIALRFVREPDRLGAVKDQIAVKKGDLLDSPQLAQAIEGHDAVISTFGPRLPVTKADAHLLEQFATALTKAMERTGLQRVVVESVAFLFKDSIIPPAYLLGRLLFPSIVADSAAMDRIFYESSLDWTMVRPPELTNKPYTGKYRIREGHLPRFGFRISRSDVADFMIKSAENHFTSRKIFGVSQ